MSDPGVRSTLCNLVFPRIETVHEYSMKITQLRLFKIEARRYKTEYLPHLSIESHL